MLRNLCSSMKGLVLFVFLHSYSCEGTSGNTQALAVQSPGLTKSENHYSVSRGSSNLWDASASSSQAGTVNKIVTVGNHGQPKPFLDEEREVASSTTLRHQHRKRNLDSDICCQDDLGDIAFAVYAECRYNPMILSGDFRAYCKAHPGADPVWKDCHCVAAETHCRHSDDFARTTRAGHVRQRPGYTNWISSTNVHDVVCAWNIQRSEQITVQTKKETELEAVLTLGLAPAGRVYTKDIDATCTLVAPEHAKHLVSDVPPKLSIAVDGLSRQTLLRHNQVHAGFKLALGDKVSCSVTNAIVGSILRLVFFHGNHRQGVEAEAASRPAQYQTESGNELATRSFDDRQSSTITGAEKFPLHSDAATDTMLAKRAWASDMCCKNAEGMGEQAYAIAASCINPSDAIAPQFRANCKQNRNAKPVWINCNCQPNTHCTQWDRPNISPRMGRWISKSTHGQTWLSSTNAVDVMCEPNVQKVDKITISTTKETILEDDLTLSLAPPGQRRKTSDIDATCTLTEPGSGSASRWHQSTKLSIAVDGLARQTLVHHNQVHAGFHLALGSRVSCSVTNAVVGSVLRLVFFRNLGRPDLPAALASGINSESDDDSKSPHQEIITHENTNLQSRHLHADTINFFSAGPTLAKRSLESDTCCQKHYAADAWATKGRCVTPTMANMRAVLFEVTCVSRTATYVNKVICTCPERTYCDNISRRKSQRPTLKNYKSHVVTQPSINIEDSVCLPQAKPYYREDREIGVPDAVLDHWLQDLPRSEGELATQYEAMCSVLSATGIVPQHSNPHRQASLIVKVDGMPIMVSHKLTSVHTVQPLHRFDKVTCAVANVVVGSILTLVVQAKPRHVLALPMLEALTGNAHESTNFLEVRRVKQADPDLRESVNDGIARLSKVVSPPPSIETKPLVKRNSASDQCCHRFVNINTYAFRAVCDAPILPATRSYSYTVWCRHFDGGDFPPQRCHCRRDNVCVSDGVPADNVKPGRQVPGQRPNTIGWSASRNTEDARCVTPANAHLYDDVEDVSVKDYLTQVDEILETVMKRYNLKTLDGLDVSCEMTDAGGAPGSSPRRHNRQQPASLTIEVDGLARQISPDLTPVHTASHLSPSDKISCIAKNAVFGSVLHMIIRSTKRPTIASITSSEQSQSSVKVVEARDIGKRLLIKRNVRSDKCCKDVYGADAYAWQAECSGPLTSEHVQNIFTVRCRNINRQEYIDALHCPCHRQSMCVSANARPGDTKPGQFRPPLYRRPGDTPQWSPSRNEKDIDCVPIRKPKEESTPVRDRGETRLEAIMREFEEVLAGKEAVCEITDPKTPRRHDGHKPASLVIAVDDIPVQVSSHLTPVVAKNLDALDKVSCIAKNVAFGAVLHLIVRPVGNTRPPMIHLTKEVTVLI